MKRVVLSIILLELLVIANTRIAAAGCEAAIASLSAWWRADGTTTDTAGGMAGTFVGKEAYATGRYGEAFALDGSSWVEVPDSPALNPTRFSLEAWVNPSQVDGDVDIILNKEAGPGGPTQYELGIKGPLAFAPNSMPQGNLAFYLGGVVLAGDDYGGWVDGLAAVPIGAWTHLVLTVGDNRVVAYVNGAPTRVVAYAGTPLVTSGPFRIGGRNPITVGTYPTVPFNGLVDEVAIYNRVLLAEEVAGLYRDGAPALCVGDVDLGGDGDTTIASGEEGIVRLEVTNLGQNPVASVTLTNIIPAGLEFLSAETAQGSCVNLAGIVRCDLGELPGGSATTVRLHVRPLAGTEFAIACTAGSTSTDFRLSNNAFTSRVHAVTRTLSVTGRSILEDDTGGHPVEIAFALNVPATAEVTVEYSTADATAIAGRDYVATNGVVRFQPGESKQVVAVEILGDADFEAAEFFELVTTRATVPLAAGSERVRVEILNDDPRPIVSVKPARIREGDSGTSELVFELNMTGSTDVPLRVAYSTASNTAKSGTDFLTAGGEVTFAPGEHAKTVTVIVNGDTVEEPNEVFFLQLTRAEGATLPEFARPDAAATIVNDDFVPGRLDHFEWGSVPSPQPAGVPFPATFQALDGYGKTITAFAGVVGLSAYPGLGPVTVVISEVALAQGNFVEFQNVTTEPVDVSGWRVTLYDDTRAPAPRATFVVPAGTVVPGSRTFALSLLPGLGVYPEFRLGDTVEWGRTPAPHRSIRSAAVVLQDAEAKVRDVFCAGPINALDISAPAELNASHWNGPSLAGDAGDFQTYQRFGNTWQPGPAGWTTGDATYNTPNPVLQLPFADSAPLVVIPPTATGFAEGAWAGSLEVQAVAPLAAVRLQVDDGNGHTGVSAPFALTFPNDLSVQLELSDSSLTLLPTSPSLLAPGFVSFTVTVTNPGPAISSNVVANLRSGFGLAFDAGSKPTASQGNASVVELAGGVIGFRADFGELPPGGMARMELPLATVRDATPPANALPHWLDAIASVTRDQPDANPANNTVIQRLEASAPCTPAAVGARAWWRAEDSGADTLGSHPATLVGGAGYAEGRVDRSWVFNGTDGGAVVADAPDLNFTATDEFTLEGWIRLTAPKGYAVIAEKSEGLFGSGAGYRLQIFNGRLSLSISDVDNPGRLAEITTFPDFHNYVLADGRWHHVSASLLRANPTSLRLSVDGLVFGPYATPLPLSGISNTAPLRIGQSAPGGVDAFFPGQIDELTLHPRVLSPQELVAIYQAGAHGKCLFALADTDGDGMDDAWEDANGFDKRDPADAGLDADSDGISNRSEFTSGTSPRDAASVLRIVVRQPGPAGITIEFEAQPGRIYVLERKAQTERALWEAIGARANLPAGSAMLADPQPPTAQAFYRVSVLR